MNYSVLFAALLLLSVAAASQERVFLEGEEPSAVPDVWRWRKEAEGASQLRFTVMLKIRNGEQLSEIFNAVSDPRSPRYGQHLTMDELVDLVAPEQEAVDTVLFWLREHGITEFKMPLTRDLVTFTTDVKTASKLLSVRFHEFELLAEVKEGVRAVSSYGGYSVPEHVARYINVVAGVTGFPLVSRANFVADEEQVRLADAVQNPLVGPAELRSAYGVPADLVGTNDTNTMAVAEFQGQFYSPADLQKYFQLYVTQSTRDTVAGVIGTNDAAKPGVEAELDIETIMGVAPNIAAYFYSDASFAFWSDLTAWMTTILSESSPKLVHSVSYGDQSLAGQPSLQYKNSLGQQFEKAGTLGMSIIVASGDAGAGCSLCARVSPSFPATSPFVTSVGATRFSNGLGSVEGAVESFGSGGGFDWELDMPAYQKSTVDAYLTEHKNTLPPASDFNAAGRSTPDVAALGIGYKIVVNERLGSVGGTSASTPTFSAIIALINDARLNAAKSSLGFLNHWIYQNPTMFTDIELGNNAHTCCRGFQAVKGYDAVTGLGTPVFSNMLQSALSLP